MHFRFEFGVVLADCDTKRHPTPFDVRRIKNTDFLPGLLDRNHHRNAVHDQGIQPACIQINEHFRQALIGPHTQIPLRLGPFLMGVTHGDANSLAIEILQFLNGGAFLDNDRASRMIVGPHKIHGLLAFRCDGHRCYDRIIFFGQQPGDDPVERGRDDVGLQPHPLGDFRADRCIKTNHLIVFIGEAEWRILATHCNPHFTGGLELCQLVRLGGSTRKSDRDC